MRSSKPLVLALVLAACAGATPPRATPSSPRAPPLTALEPIVRALARETAAIRGLPFLRDVPVRVESAAEITRHLRDERAPASKESDAEALEARVATALGLLPDAVDRTEALARFVGAEAQGYYDPDDATLVLTEAEAASIASLGPNGYEARGTVVHELTHALQHQHFPGRVTTGPIEPPDASDAARARLALLEGDATLVAMEWASRRRARPLLGASDLVSRVVQWADGAQVLTDVDVPTYLLASAEVPYELGAIGVAKMYASGGWTRVNAALADVTLRAAGVLHPDREPVTFVNVPPPDDAALTAAGMRRSEVRSLGEIELLLLLERAMRRERAAELAASWRGDAFALYEGDGRVAARWTLALASADDAANVVARLAGPIARQRAEGCPRVVGGTSARCPVELIAEGDRVLLRRGR